MQFKKIMVCLSLLVIFLSISSVSALENIEINETIEIYSSQGDNEYISEIESLSDSLEFNEDSILLDSDDETKDCEIFIGLNDENGNGSKENPYKTFDLACENVKDKNNVTINVFNGTYYLGSTLKFNCSNLHIKGIGENVIIKNQYDIAGTARNDGSKQAFSLTSLTGTFKISNITFDSSDWTQRNRISASNSKMTTYYYIFYNYLGNNTVIVNNCKFKQCINIVPPIEVSSNNVPHAIHNTTFNFNHCIFEYVKNNKQKNEFSWDSPCHVNLTYCLFKFKSDDWGNNYYKIYDSWFGKNILSNDVKGEINRYAKFSIAEEKIDDNTYDIIGKLMWNDSTNDGIENLPPMTVTLTSETGEIPATATLENGMFKVRYTTNAKEHNITAKLDSEELNLTFNYDVDINAEAKPINYGDDQNITINLPYNASGIIKLTFEDETSEEIQITKVSSLNYTIKKALKAGTNKINVSLIDEDSHSYGSTVIDYTISKISEYTLDIDMPKNVTVGDTVEITVSLPEGAKGNVTAFVGKNNFTKEITENIVKINVTGFVAGENEVTINYTGDDKYSEKIIPQIISVKKVETPVNNNTLVEGTQSDSNKPTFTINLPSDATGNLTVTINGKNYTKELVNGSATIVVDDLPAGEYNATITYSGDDKYNPIIKNTTTIVKEVAKPTNTKIDNNKVTKKAATKITAKKKTFKAKKKIKKYTITLKSGKKPVKKVWVTLKIKGKKLLKAKTNAKGKATFKIKKLTKKGKYNAVIKFKGNKNYKACSKKVKITIKK